MRRCSFLESDCGVMVSTIWLPCLVTARSLREARLPSPPLRMYSKTAWKVANCGFFWLLVL